MIMLKKIMGKIMLKKIMLAHMANGKHVHIYKSSKRKHYSMQKTGQRRMHVQQYKYPSSDYIGTFPHHKSNSTN